MFKFDAKYSRLIHTTKEELEVADNTEDTLDAYMSFLLNRNVWRSCATTVNRTWRRGTNAIAPYMMLPQMTAKICLRTWVRIIEAIELCINVIVWQV